jgi:hypothetical protein
VWQWFKRTPSWVRTTVQSFLPAKSPRLKGIRFSYEKAGLSVTGEPVPWNAEAVVVEALIGLAPNVIYHKSDFQLRSLDHPPRMAVLLHADKEEGIVRVVFRLPPPRHETTAAIYFRGCLLGCETLPFLTAQEFFHGLRLESPTIFILLDGHSVACQTFVEGQCRGLTAGGVLAGPTSLLPLADVPLRVDFVDRATSSTQSVSLRLTRSQLQSNQACISVMSPQRPHGFDPCSARWILGGTVLATAEVRRISQAAFQQSLYLVEGRYLSAGEDGSLTLRHHPPGRDEAQGFRPCFLVASREPGVAGLCTLDVRVQFRDRALRPLLRKQEMLVMDGPSLCLPDLASVAGSDPLHALELLIEGRHLGVLSASPTPVAVFNGEGGFRAAEDFPWTPVVEEELVDRLEKLMEIATAKESSALASVAQE